MRVLLVIHIGLPKAGSASIQSFLSLNETALRAMDIDYPKIGRGSRKDHHNFSSELKGRKNFDPSVGTLNEFYEYSCIDPCATRVLSTEKFEKLEPYQIAELKRMLRGFGHKFRIVMIVRDLLELIPSSYGQKIRYGFHTFDFDTFFEERLRQSRTSYFETAKKWADVFKWQRMRIRFLAPQNLANGDLIDDFLTTAGLDVGRPEVHGLPRPGVVNTTAGWRILEALRALYSGEHELDAGHPLVMFTADARRSFDRKVIEAAAMKVGSPMGWAADRGLYLTRDQAERGLEVFRESVLAMNACLSEPLPLPMDLEVRGFVERDFMPHANQIPGSELRSFYDQLGEALADADVLRAELQAGRVWQGS